MPSYSIFRCSENKKWYAVLYTLIKKKLGVDSNKICEVINLIYINNQDVVNNKTIFEGYHSNKKNWISICLDEGEDINSIYNFIDKSYLFSLKNK